MSEKLGGIKYDETQQLVYGNSNYELNKSDNNFEVKVYDKEDLKVNNLF